jgi:hypothetical protein
MKNILASRLFGVWKKLYYPIKWKGYNNVSWKLAAAVNGVPAIDKFHEQSAEKRGPLMKDK